MKAKESSQPGRTHSTAIFISQNHSFFFPFQVCHLLWKTTKSVYSALGRRACFSSLNRGEYWPTMIPMLLIPPGSLQDWSHLALLPPPGPFLLNLWIVECLLFIGRAPRSFGDWIRLSYMFSFHGLFDFIFNVNPYFKIWLSLVNKKIRIQARPR